MSILADIHCHLVPFVDDGAATLETALRLLELEVEQGVCVICVTPHLRRRMFETPDEEVRRQFLRLQQAAKQAELPLELYLSREYHCDELFWQHLKEGSIMPLGNGSTILLEFSGSHTYEQIADGVRRVQAEGLTPLLAHVERYGAIRRTPENAQRLADAGALLQCNAECVLGREGFWAKRFVHNLIRSNLVSVIASDAHDPDQRIPSLGECARYMSKKFGKDRALMLTSTSPRNILNLDHSEKRSVIHAKD